MLQIIASWNSPIKFVDNRMEISKHLSHVVLCTRYCLTPISFYTDEVILLYLINHNCPRETKKKGPIWETIIYYCDFDLSSIASTVTDIPVLRLISLDDLPLVQDPLEVKVLGTT